MTTIRVPENGGLKPASVTITIKKEVKAEHFNYIIEMQKLVAQIFTELGRISANDHESIEKMKQKYMTATIKSAHLQADSGRVGRNIAITAVGVFFLTLGLRNADDRAIIKIVSDQAPSLAGMYQNTIQSQMMESRGEAELEMAKYNTKTASKQADGNMKQDYISLLQSVAENQKSASRSNG